MNAFRRIARWPKWFKVLVSVSLIFLVAIGPKLLASNFLLLALYLLPLSFGLFFMLALADLNMELVQAFSKTIECKDQYTRGHSLRVATCAREIAKTQRFVSDLRRQVFVAGLLHDIGKIGVPEHILQKPGGLNAKEKELIQDHVILGANILEGLSGFCDIVQMIGDHHERWDGSGYPKGKRETEISLGGRILAVADAYDAMISTRVYRSAMNKEEAIREIRKCSGSQFDPKVVEAFARIMDKQIKEGAKG